MPSGDGQIRAHQTHTTAKLTNRFFKEYLVTQGKSSLHPGTVKKIKHKLNIKRCGWIHVYKYLKNKQYGKVFKNIDQQGQPLHTHTHTSTHTHKHAHTQVEI